MYNVRYVMTVILLFIIITSAHAEWIKVRITVDNSRDWPPAPIPEWRGENLERLDSLAFDPVRKVLVLFKGRRTFEYDRITWTIKDHGNTEGPGHPGSDFPLWNPLLIYHPDLGGVFLYGGSTDYSNATSSPGTVQCWIWTGIKWNSPPDTDISRRPPAGAHTGTYDPVGKAVIIFGGHSVNTLYLKGTYIYRNDIWTKFTSGKPTHRVRAAMAYDAYRQKVVLYGGYREQYFPYECRVLSDTWEWDGEEWTRITNSGPGPRACHSLVYLPELKRVVLFGGFSSVSYDPRTAKKTPVPHNDLWSWDGKTWTRLPHTRPAPNPRYGHGATYDSDSHQMVIYGGEDGTRSFRDLWYYRAEK